MVSCCWTFIVLLFNFSYAFYNSRFTSLSIFHFNINSIQSQSPELDSWSPEPSKRSWKNLLIEGVVGSVFKVRPLFKIASRGARKKIIDRAKLIDVDWDKNTAELNRHINDLQVLYENFESKSLQYPSYYLKPFHAYDDGNLCWQAAMEVESAALSVHANLFTPSPKEMEIVGDFKLRDNFHINLKKIFEKYQFKPSRILDIGCSTGLSTLKFLESFPSVEVIGVDLSPYMLSVAKYNLDKMPSLTKEEKASVTYLHASGEDSTLGKGDVDLVSLSLVSHELPSAASKAIFEAAYRILPTGGAISIMDMNPSTPKFQKVFSNPFAFAAFKSTEPWLQEYISMDMYDALRACGFRDVQMLANSPGHRTVVGFKQ